MPFHKTLISDKVKTDIGRFHVSSLTYQSNKDRHWVTNKIRKKRTANERVIRSKGVMLSKYELSQGESNQ